MERPSFRKRYQKNGGAAKFLFNSARRTPVLDFKT
jgi:hypothetical protein